jgi:hypothetical protein
LLNALVACPDSFYTIIVTDFLNASGRNQSRRLIGKDRGFAEPVKRLPSTGVQAFVYISFWARGYGQSIIQNCLAAPSI